MRILIVAAHPDDEILGCGGTVARLIDEEYEAYTLILGDGTASRKYGKQKNERESDLTDLKEQIFQANNIIGVQEVFAYDCPDNRFDGINLLDIVKVIENIKNEIQPDIIFTHYEKDLDIDHQITFKAVITATKPFGKESVKEIYSFEVPYSTKLSFPLSFSPDVFFNISNTLDLKLKAMECYEPDFKKFNNPKSFKGIKLDAQNRGMNVGLKYAEAFKCVRIIK